MCRYRMRSTPVLIHSDGPIDFVIVPCLTRQILLRCLKSRRDLSPIKIVTETAYLTIRNVLP